MNKFKKLTMSPETTKSGFTIIEVTLVTAFMAMLLIAIAVITTSIAALYQKGLTLKTINSVGRNLITEFTTSINSAPSIDSVSLCNTLLSGHSDAIKACLQDNAYKYVYYSLEGSTENPDTHEEEAVQYGGIMCTGNYSYVWNTHYGLESGAPNLRLAYSSPDPSVAGHNVNRTEEGFKLIRFRDRTYRACSAIMSSDSYGISNEFENTHEINIRQLANGSSNVIAEVQDNFLETSDLDLYLYELTIFPVSQDSVTLRGFFSGTFILATDRGGVNIIRTGDYCSVGDAIEDDEETTTDIFNLGSEFNYCGINKFNFAARTAGSGV